MSSANCKSSVTYCPPQLIAVVAAAAGRVKRDAKISFEINEGWMALLDRVCRGKSDRDPSFKD